MLEPVGLGVQSFERQAESFGEVALEQPVVPDHLERDPLPRLREQDTAVTDVLDQAESREPLQHRRRRGRGHTHPGREKRGRHALPFRPQREDRLQVVLDRVRHMWKLPLLHRLSVTDRLAMV